MQQAKIPIRWTEGLHLRRAARLVRVGQGFRSKISFRLGGKIADVGSIVSIAALCASMGSVVDVEITGEDEMDAARAIEQVFAEEADTSPVDRILA